MKRNILILIPYLILLPQIGYSRSADPLSAIIGIFLIAPYYLFAIIPFLVQRGHKGESLFRSILTYVLCFLAIEVANYQINDTLLPKSNTHGEGGLLFMMCLPYFIIAFMAFIKDLNYWHDKEHGV